MKNFLFAFAAGCVSALAVTGTGYAQVSSNITATSLSNHLFKAGMAITPEEDNTLNMAVISRKAINDLKRSYKDLKRSYNAAKSFRKSYKTATGEKWYKISDGFVADFTSDGIRNRVFYNNGGQWSGSLKEYSEDKLPVNVRYIVKSAYFDYKIDYVEEIETKLTRGVPTYVIHAEDDKTIKLIRVSDEEMDIYKEFDKQ